MGKVLRALERGVAPSGPTRDDWLRALDAAGMPQQDDREAVTVTEFMALMNLSRMTASRQLRQLVIRGKATEVRKMATLADGRRYSCLAYRLVK
jgi:hypothetical protein